MRIDDGRGAYSDNNSDTESIASDRTAFSGPLGAPKKKSASRKSARFNLPPETSSNGGGGGDDYVEITLDITDDSVAVHSVHAAGGGAAHEDPELALLAKRTLEKKTSIGSSIFRNTSSHIKQMSQELKRITSVSRKPSARRFDRTKSAATHALKGLKFIATKTSGWDAVSKRFDDLTAGSNGLLKSSEFGECIGMNKDKEFADELFRALARRHNISGDSINKAQLKMFWEQISDESFDSRLQTFFDM